MNGDEPRIEDEAAAWHAASDHDDMDWDGFTRWLAADPRHRKAFDEVALAGALLGEHRELLANPVTTLAIVGEREPEPRTERRVWPLWLGGGLAASLAAVLFTGQVVAPAPIVVASGESAMTVDLGDRSSALLAPHSRLTIGGRQATELALEGGAYFDIRHDPARSL